MFHFLWCPLSVSILISILIGFIKQRLLRTKTVRKRRASGSSMLWIRNNLAGGRLAKSVWWTLLSSSGWLRAGCRRGASNTCNINGNSGKLPLNPNEPPWEFYLRPSYSSVGLVSKECTVQTTLCQIEFIPYWHLSRSLGSRTCTHTHIYTYTLHWHQQGHIVRKTHWVIEQHLWAKTVVKIAGVCVFLYSIHLCFHVCIKQHKDNQHNYHTLSAGKQRCKHVTNIPGTECKLFHRLGTIQCIMRDMTLHNALWEMVCG